MKIYNQLIDFDSAYNEIATPLLKKFGDSGVVTKANISTHILDRLKIFGNNVMVDYEDIVTISNYHGTAPGNMYRLNFVMKCKRDCPPPCDPCGKNKLDQADARWQPFPTVQRVYKWAETNRYIDTYNGCDDCDREIHEEYGCKTINFPDHPKFKLFAPHPVSFGKGMRSGLCAKSCLSCNDRHSKYAVEIIDGNVKTNFKEGNLYFQYYGVPIDEEGLPMIHDSKKGLVWQHIKYYVLFKLFEEIQYDDEGAIPFREYNERKMKETVDSAIKDANQSTFSNEAYINLYNRNRMYIERFFRTGPPVHNFLVRNRLGVGTNQGCERNNDNVCP